MSSYASVCVCTGGADQHSEEILPSHFREELFIPVQRSQPAQHAQPHQHHDGAPQML